MVISSKSVLRARKGPVAGPVWASARSAETMGPMMVAAAPNAAVFKKSLRLMPAAGR
jgi:hypothetical protein